MSSINTNASAMTALQSLNMTNKRLEATQSAISTGFKVNSAKDNAAYWSIATTMRSDNKALSTVQDALGLGSATLDVANTALTSTIDVADEIKKKLVAAREPGIDRGKVQTEITELQNQLQSIATSASFSGENWLSVDASAVGYNGTKSIVSSFNRDSSGVSISTIDVDITGIELYDADDQSGIIDQDRTIGLDTFKLSTIDISALTDSAADLLTLENYIKGTDSAISEMTTAATNIGAAQSRVDIQKDFVSNLMDAVDRGIGQLVDADMTEESTKLQALQTQQQLGVQALSIANGQSQSILSLFR